MKMKNKARTEPGLWTPTVMLVFVAYANDHPFRYKWGENQKGTFLKSTNLSSIADHSS